MKNKSARHKETNTFKFQPFNERISQIDIDIFHRVKHENETENENEIACIFRQTIQKWNILNLTKGYSNFRKEVNGIITLPQLLFQKDHVFKTLLKHLQIGNELSLQPLLELVVAFAKDLCKEFYPYYKVFLNQLIELLNIKNTEVLEWTFQCLAYLFKLLWRYMLKDLHEVVNSLLPLLDNSQPEYINNFAAESFAFVGRKIKDRETFFLLIVNLISTNPDTLAGCARLLFEIVRGVSGQFHSCADELLPFYFNSLSNSNYDQKVTFELLEQIIYNIHENISAKKAAVFWSSIIEAIDNFHQQWDKNKCEKSIIDIQFLLKLLGQAIELKNGKFVEDPESIINLMIRLIDSDISEQAMEILSQISAVLLLSGNIILSQEIASRLTLKILAIKHIKIRLTFIENVIESSSFEFLVLPWFLEYCIVEKLNADLLHLLGKIVFKKSPLSLKGDELVSWTVYPLDFPISKQISQEFDINKKFSEILRVENLNGNLDNSLCALICLPHIKNLNKTEAAQLVNVLIKQICENIQNFEENNEWIYALYICIETLAHLQEQQISDENLNSVFECLKPFLNDFQKICALRALDLLLSSCSNCMIKENLLKQHYEILYKNLSSEFHEIRLLTTHILSLFDKFSELNQLKTEDGNMWQLFTICYNVESVKPNVQTYRDQLLHLSHLNFDKPQCSLYKDTRYKDCPLRYLLGSLYINFQLLWDPIIKIIGSQALEMNVDEFWTIFLDNLHNSINLARKKDQQFIVKNYSCENIKCDFLLNSYSTVFEIVDKPDYDNHRILLWKAMAEFTEIIQSKNRDVSPLLLNFVESEYLNFNSDTAKTWNIKKNEKEISDVSDQNLTKSEEQELEDEDKEIAEIETVMPKKSGKFLIKCLLAHLNVFSKMQNPRTIHREPELYQLYLDLLMNTNSEIQKSALDCIMTYKHKYLVPYKDHLYALIDEKRFKNELALFRIDQESEVILAEHRQDFIPIVLRIAYSKMVTKTGLRTGGKAGGQLKRSLVIQFLSGCQENEILIFINMAFKIFLPYMKAENFNEMITNIENTIDLEKMIPPKKLQSTINLLAVILDKFGTVDTNKLLPYLLKMLLCVGSILKASFAQSSSIHPGYLSQLRLARKSCTEALIKFFEHYEMYDWNELEIEAVFDIFIWPYLNKLAIEGIHSPIALLKLCLIWSQNPRFFTLFVKTANNNEDHILPHIIKLLMHPKSHISVKNVIMQIIEHLVTLQLDEEDKSVKAILVKNTFKFDSENINDLKQKLNYGSTILLPHVSSILEKLQQKIAIKNKHLNKQELCILSRISEMIFDQKTNKNLINLLFPVLMKKSSLNMTDEEQIVHFVTTLCNLIQNIDDSEQYLHKVAPLFSSVNSQQPRKLLCQLIETISNKNEKLRTTAKIINMMNAWDVKWLDKADSAKRLEAFKEIYKKIDDNTMEMELGIIVIHNCFYLLRNDVTLLDSITHCLRMLTVYLIKKYETNSQAKELIINGTLLQLIRNGFKEKNNETFRNESISLLGHLARECPESHLVLRDLECLTSKEDSQVDFFENLVHLQLLRHARALFRFNQIGKKLIKAPHPRTLTQFVLPLVTHYLNDEKYANKNNIIDGAIEAVGIICRFLPWHQYELVLRFYLGKLRRNIEFQKQLVRLIISILDAFHFNLSKATIEKESLNIENSKKENENKNEDNEDDLDLESDVEDEEYKDDINLPEEKTNVDVIAIEKETILAPSAAKRLISSITSGLLPQLHKTISQLTAHESSHKVNRKRTGAEREEDDLLRVPIALAVVKLLQKLPEGMLNRNLPGIFMKLCTFLKSPLDSVRRACREILQKIMTTVGPKHLPILLDEITPLMSRGFQVHVLVFTIHAVLVSLKDQFEAGDLDKCLSTILQLCQTDIFGVLADEKEVAHIVSKTSEAKSTKSYDTFQILAQFITEKCFMDLLFPIKEIVNSSLEYKKVRKAEECLRRIVLGLVDNEFISSESLVIFAYGTASASIADFKIDDVKPKKLTNKEKALNQDCFIIPGEPKNRFGEVRSGVKQLSTTNAHILVEFGLRLCYFILKREKLKNSDCRAYLDPFVPILSDCLNSKHVKLCTLTLHCLCWIFKIDLPSMKTNIKSITNAIFLILHKYAAGGLSKGDNFDLVMAAFKAMSTLIKDVKYFILEEEQLKTILLYAEQDLHDSDRQATAFSLLKAIISRKFIVPELHNVMEKVAQTSITSESANTRIQSRQIFHKFLMDYPLKKALKKHVAFYLAQLNYELQFGRESALKMVLGLIQSFPQEVLDLYFETFFVTLGPRLINDDIPECRKLVATCLTTLLQRLKKKQINELMEILIVWLKDKNISHRRLAAQMCGIIVQVEKNDFERHLKELLPLLLEQFTFGEPGKFVRRQANITENDNEERKKDHHLFQVLQLLLKLCVNCSEFLTCSENVETFAFYAQSLLAYPHEWVRLASVQFIGFVMTKLDPDHIAQLIIEEKTDPIGYLSSNDPNSTVKSLILDLTAQLQPEVTKAELAEQVIKNLLFLTKILKHLPLNNKNKTNVSLIWLIKKMRKINNLEIAQTPSISLLREAIFKWIGGVARILDKNQLKEVLYYLMGPLVREANLEDQPCKSLKQLSKEISYELKTRVGLEEYTNILTKLTSNLDIRRAERKRERAQIAVTNPEIAAKRKMKLQAKKQELKKRKIANMKGVKYTKKRKLEDIVAEDNDDF